MAMNSLKDIYLDQLQDIWSANTQSLPVVTELGRAAQDKDLSEALIDGGNGISDGIAEIEKLCNEHGIEPNAERAVSVLTESCETSGGSPCEVLSRFYRSGNHVPTDHEKAKQLLDKACHTGSARACYFLAGVASEQLRDHGYAKALLSRTFSASDFLSPVFG